MIKRIGFACKISTIDPKKGIIAIPEYNSKSTTVAWLNRQSRSIAEDRLWDLMKFNIEAAYNAVKYIGNLEENLKCFRLGSDILPVYTEPSWSYFYRQSDVRDYAERGFRRVGDMARENNIRLSMHPGQFCVLASDNPDIVKRSIEEFEYHADMARWMGYGQEFQDFKINVHISGRCGPQGIRNAYTKLSPEARNCITIENEEISYGLDDCITLCDLVPIVLDIHHNWIREGEYIDISDPRIQHIIDSWRGRRPIIHYSVSREEHLVDHPSDRYPSLNALIEGGHKKQKLRAHSDYYWNKVCNEWALTHLSWSDIMCESKAKNLASVKLYEEAKTLNLL